MNAAEIRQDIIRRLRDAFAPETLDVIDESELHFGHAAYKPGGGTHFRVHIVSRTFEGKSRIDRHRMINQVLADDLAGDLHALVLQAQAPGEA